MTSKSIWTDEMADALQSMWEGGLSANLIAREIGEQFGITVTRNSVIGKSTRLGLVGRPSPINARKEKRAPVERPFSLRRGDTA